jgi:hypothetical protein
MDGYGRAAGRCERGSRRDRAHPRRLRSHIMNRLWTRLLLVLLLSALPTSLPRTAQGASEVHLRVTSVQGGRGSIPMTSTPLVVASSDSLRISVSCEPFKVDAVYSLYLDASATAVVSGSRSILSVRVPAPGGHRLCLTAKSTLGNWTADPVWLEISVPPGAEASSAGQADHSSASPARRADESVGSDRASAETGSSRRSRLSPLAGAGPTWLSWAFFVLILGGLCVAGFGLWNRHR